MFTFDTILNDVVAYESMCSVHTINDSTERLSFYYFHTHQTIYNIYNVNITSTHTNNTPMLFVQNRC